MSVTFNVKGYIDRRSDRELEAAAHILVQRLERQDRGVIAEWRERVRVNEQRRLWRKRAIRQRSLPKLLQVQAD